MNKIQPMVTSEPEDCFAGPRFVMLGGGGRGGGASLVVLAMPPSPNVATIRCSTVRASYSYVVLGQCTARASYSYVVLGQCTARSRFHNALAPY